MQLKRISIQSKYQSLQWMRDQLLKVSAFLFDKKEPVQVDIVSTIFQQIYPKIEQICANAFTAHKIIDDVCQSILEHIEGAEAIIHDLLMMIIEKAQLENKAHISNAAKLVLNKMGLDEAAAEITRDKIISINPKAYHLITTNLEEMVIGIKNSFHAERINSFHYYGPDITVRRADDGFNVLILLPLAMSVNDGEWHGGENYIQTKGIFSDDKIQIFRKMTEVIPKPSNIDPIQPDYTHLLNRSVILDVEPIDTLKARFTAALEPVFHENLTAQAENAIINNADASSD